MLRLLILDVEGVVGPAGGSQYPWDLAALAEVRALLDAAPVPAVLCTGRQAPYAEAVIQALGLLRPAPPSGARPTPEFLGWPSIVENGACFLDPLAKRLIPHPALGAAPENLQRRLRALLAPLEATGAVIEAGKEYTLSLNPPPVHPGDRERMRPAAWLPEVAAALTDLAGEVDLKASESAVDLTPRGIGKAQAVRTLREWFGLAAGEVAGVGDSAADAAWLAKVGWRAAPANGRTALPGLDFYASEPEARGLALILRRLAALDWAS